MLKEKLQTWLLTLKGSILKKARMTTGAFEITPSVMDVCLKVKPNHFLVGNSNLKM